jgi:fumarate reductase flavoprotein subunit
VGAGTAGLCAALAAYESGTEVIVLEGDSLPGGSTALSAGLIPAARTRFQQTLGISDSAEQFATDIRRKGHDEADAAIINMVAEKSGATIEWLADSYGFPFTVVDDFDYPGHSARRMHGLPSRTGIELIDRLRRMAEQRAIPILVSDRVTGLFADDDRVIRGVEISRPDGMQDKMGCEALILACNGYGYGAAADLVARHIPEMRSAYYFGHPGNRGDAVVWGQGLRAKLLHMSGYQGHGSRSRIHMAC